MAKIIERTDDKIIIKDKHGSIVERDKAGKFPKGVSGNPKGSLGKNKGWMKRATPEALEQYKKAVLKGAARSVEVRRENCKLNSNIREKVGEIMSETDETKKKSMLEEMKDGKKAAEEKNGKEFWQHAFERAYESDIVLNNLTKSFPKELFEELSGVEINNEKEVVVLTFRDYKEEDE